MYSFVSDVTTGIRIVHPKLLDQSFVSFYNDNGKPANSAAKPTQPILSGIWEFVQEWKGDRKEA